MSRTPRWLRAPGSATCRGRALVQSGVVVVLRMSALRHKILRECHGGPGHQRPACPGTSERRPLGDAVADTSGRVTKRAPSLAGQSTRQSTISGAACLGSPYLGSPPAAGRAWVPGCHARTGKSVTPFYDGSAGMHRGQRYRSVISIDRPVHILLAGGGAMAGGVLAPNVSTGQPRCWAILRSARSGFTTRGLPTVSSIGRSVTESL